MNEKRLRLVNEKAIAELLDVSVGKVNKLMEKIEELAIVKNYE